MEIIWQPKAWQEVDSIGLYIANESTEQADRVTGMIEQSPEVLRIHPEFGAVVPEFGERVIRELRVFHYRIIYRLIEDDEVIEILSVVHGARKLTRDMIE